MLLLVFLAYSVFFFFFYLGPIIRIQSTCCGRLEDFLYCVIVVQHVLCTRAYKENLKGLLRQQAITKQQMRVVSLQLEDSALSLRAACEALVESEQHFAAMSSQLTYLEGTSVAPVPSHQPPPAEAAGSSTPAVDTAVAVDLSSPDDLGLRNSASPAFEVLLVCERW